MYFQTIYFLRKFSFLQNDQSFILKKKNVLQIQWLNHHHHHHQVY